MIQRAKRWTLRLVIALIILSLLVGGIAVAAWYGSRSYKVVGVPVLNYHQVNDKYVTPLTIPTKTFREQMDYLASHGFHTISMDQLYAYLTEEAELPDKPVVITFDDGYIDNYENVLPILKQHGFTATLFMIGDDINKSPRFVTADQLRAMDANGFIVEGHTYTHRRLPDIPEGELYSELVKGKQAVEAVVGHSVDYLAYPGGYNNEAVRNAAQAANYKMAFTVAPGNVQPGDDLYKLNRLAIFENDVTYYSFLIRLHYPAVVDALWSWRDQLRDSGHPDLAKIVPLF